jgi:hypothetical protein
MPSCLDGAVAHDHCQFECQITSDALLGVVSERGKGNELTQPLLKCGL